MGSRDPIIELLTRSETPPAAKIWGLLQTLTVARSLTLFGPLRGVTNDATTDSGFALRSARTNQATRLHFYCGDDPRAWYRC